MFRSHVLICGGTGCTSSGSAALREALEKELAAKQLENEIKIVVTGCFGLCALGPVMIVYPDGTFYSMVTPEDIPEIVEEHLLKGRPVTVWNITKRPATITRSPLSPRPTSIKSKSVSHCATAV